MGNLIPARLALLDRAAELPKRLDKERFNIVGLKSACLSPFHVFTDAMNPGHIHGVMGEDVVLDKILQFRLVEGSLDNLCQPRAHLRLLAIANGIDQQFTQSPAFELDLAKHVEHLTAE